MTVLAFDPLWYERSWWPVRQPVLLVTNIVSVFIDGIVGGKVTGYVTTPPWLNNPHVRSMLSPAVTEGIG